MVKKNYTTRRKIQLRSQKKLCSPNDGILIIVSGKLCSGNLVAVLGSSGAGKTTLLAAISQRFRGPITGKILLNGSEIDRKTITNISCFVPQFEQLNYSLTPMEHLTFMAELRLDRRWASLRKKQRVEFLLRELSLLDVARNRISTWVNLNGWWQTWRINMDKSYNDQYALF